MIHRMLKVLLLVLLLAGLGGCGAQSRLLRSWHDPKGAHPVQDLLVVGISTSESAVRLWERILVEEFARQGVKARSAIQVTGFMPEPDKKVLRAALARTGARSVLITHVLDKSSSTYTRPGYVRYVPSGFYSNLYGYYGHAYRAVHLPPQDVTRTTIILETNLYDAHSGQLLWTAQTSSKDPRLLKKDFSKGVNLLIDDLGEKGMLPK